MVRELLRSCRWHFGTLLQKWGKMNCRVKRDFKFLGFTGSVLIKIPRKQSCPPLPQIKKGVRLYFSATHALDPANGLFKSLMSSWLRPYRVYSYSRKISARSLEFLQEADVFKLYFHFHQVLRENSKQYIQTDHRFCTPSFPIHHSW
jgi:hypothetical protein